MTTAEFERSEAEFARLLRNLSGESQRLGLRKAADAQGNEPPPEWEGDDWADCRVSGANGRKYRARYHPPSGRLMVLDDAGAPLSKSLVLSWPATGAALGRVR